MRIAVVGASPIPFCRGGIENFMAGLCRGINDYTAHSAKYPAWNLRHRNHIIYLGHRLRGLYDTYPIPPEDDSLLKHSPFAFPGPWIKRIVHWLDNRAIRPETISHAFCTSHTIASRKVYFHPDVPPKVVYHSTVHEDYYTKPGEHLFTVNRLDAPKRVDLMIRAYRQVTSDIPFLIAGTGPHMPVLQSLARGDDRIRFLGDVSEEELKELYARSIGVLYTPFAEDYGLITVEAMKSSKPVITTSDSGGPLEFVKHRENGWIADPNPESLAACIQELVNETDSLAEMGRAALGTVSGISWRNTVEHVLKSYRYWPVRESRKSGERRRITILTPYPIYPARSGGQRRVAGISQQLSSVYDVFILSLGRFNTPEANLEINPWLHEIRVPQSSVHAGKQWGLEKAVGETVSDVALDKLLPLTPNYIRALKHFAEASDIIVSEQPYMHCHIPVSRRLRLVVHSSQNFEYNLKKDILSRTATGRKLLKDTRRVESVAVERSDILFTTSSEEGTELVEFYGRERGKWALAPNGVDTDEIRPFSADEKREARERLDIPLDQAVLLFVGAWHPPNLEALEFIISRLSTAFGDALFLVVGSVRDHYLNQGGNLETLPGNIRLTGEVTEEYKNDALAAADIALNPMLSGAGTNLKILEYAAAGLPTASTCIGIRGLALKPDIDVCVADPENFEKALSQIIHNPELQKKYAKSARQTVIDNYDWKSIGSHIIDTIEQSIPPIGPSVLDMKDLKAFTFGWHQPESWQDTDTGPGTVRWTSDKAHFCIPSLRKPVAVKIKLMAGKPEQNLKVYREDVCLFDETLKTGWQTISFPLTPGPGEDDLNLTLVAEPWSPADSGSPDARILGVAVSEIRQT